MHENGQPEENSAFTVTQALRLAKRDLEKIRITVIGEVSEVTEKEKYPAVYFSVHDDSSSMQCLMWNGYYELCGFKLQPGMLVELTGFFSCFTGRGALQFDVRKMQLAGEGRLRMQVAQLARKLEAEGLMDASRKRRIPALPRRIAVVTSPNGKAIHDVIRTLRRRYPLGQLYVCGVTVEGPHAPDQIIAGLNAACSADPAPDVILLVRGGGSYEALMPFNDERLARAVAASPIPVVTGIGHEPDNSICDMVSDFRSSTPTAAAEAIAPSIEELYGKLNNASAALDRALRSYLQAQEAQLELISRSPVWRDSHYITGNFFQTLDGLGDQLSRAIPDALTADARELEKLKADLIRALPERLKKEAHDLELSRNRLIAIGPQVKTRFGRDVSLSAAKLEALSPLKTLARGYSITYAQDGRSVIETVSQTQKGASIQVQLQDGRLACTVDDIERMHHE